MACLSSSRKNSADIGNVRKRLRGVILQNEKVQKIKASRISRWGKARNFSFITRFITHV